MPSGPTPIYSIHEYEYSTTTYPEEHQIFYKWNWGDSITDWIGPYNSGELVTMTHAWDGPGDYEITVKAKDDPNSDGNHSDGVESNWSGLLCVNVFTIGDVNGDGVVDVLDLHQPLGRYGWSC